MHQRDTAVETVRAQVAREAVHAVGACQVPARGVGVLQIDAETASHSLSIEPKQHLGELIYAGADVAASARGVLEQERNVDTRGAPRRGERRHRVVDGRLEAAPEVRARVHHDPAELRAIGRRQCARHHLDGSRQERRIGRGHIREVRNVDVPGEPGPTETAAQHVELVEGQGSTRVPTVRVDEHLDRLGLDREGALHRARYAARSRDLCADADHAMYVRPVTTLLVANRGEIARRVMRTAKRMGMRTVAVYSDADADAPHVREADAAVPIGPAPARDSYLSVERILAAARESGADLVHPGYGFLSEDPSLARAVTDAGITFVGPPADVLALLGSKAEAKAVARRAGVPILPGYAEEDQRDPVFVDMARIVGYPLMVKPVAGGGGIGMQIVEDPAGLRDALARARRAALAAFGDERLMLEKYVPSPRHVEVQILADQHQRIRALGERDCSAQRRHQKIVEEAPAPGLSKWQREKLAQWAVAMAQASRYVGAGTVEFVLDAGGDAHFLEVNARLQVEHTVTEEVTRFDLVEQQLRIALGERLTLGKAQPHGHAIEARVYAEDPASGFLPSTGRLLHVRWPDGVRVDAGYEEGSVVTGNYDPLLAKIVARAIDRPRALDALADALERTEILGVRTNIPFLLRYASHPGVRASKVTTTFVEQEIDALVSRDGPPDEVYAAAAASVLDDRPRGSGDPWSALGAWRAGTGHAGTAVLRDGAHERALSVEGDGPYVVGDAHVARDPSEEHMWTVAGRSAAVARDDPSVWVSWRGATYELRTDPIERGVGDVAATEIVAPMPGIVLSLHASAGQHVGRGDLIAIVEAMKMELRVEAPAAGTVSAVLVRPGEQVKRGQRIADFGPET